VNFDHRIWLSLLLLPVVLYFLRGCPICWTIGLFETIAMVIRKRFSSDGRGAASVSCPVDARHRDR
jgi:hypothetical protein